MTYVNAPSTYPKNDRRKTPKTCKRVFYAVDFPDAKPQIMLHATFSQLAPPSLSKRYVHGCGWVESTGVSFRLRIQIGVKLSAVHSISCERPRRISCSGKIVSRRRNPQQLDDIQIEIKCMEHVPIKQPTFLHGIFSLVYKDIKIGYVQFRNYAHKLAPVDNSWCLSLG